MSGSEQSKSIFRLSKFSHIYIEGEAKDLPLTKEIISRLPSSKIIFIDRYQEILNRQRQSWRESKIVQKLILAVRRENYLYPRSDVIQNINIDRFFYTTPILNCVYDCAYCFLQGMFKSPHAVIFVNDYDFFKAIDDERSRGPLYLSPSYETDLLAFEGIVPLTSRWVEYAATRPDLTLEIRTKSASYRSISKLSPLPNVILAWTVSPPTVAQKFESGTPSTKSRIMAVKQALDDGWNVRLCFDPILQIEGWRDIYGDFVASLAEEIDLSRIYDLWIGTFRMGNDYLKTIKKVSNSELLFAPFEVQGGVARYRGSIPSDMEAFVADALSKWVRSEKIVRDQGALNPTCS